MSGALVRYEQARTAIAECRRVDDAKDIADKALALQTYARQANDPEMEAWVAEIRLRARRRVGELSAALDKAPSGRASVSLPSDGKSKTDALAAAGLSSSEAHRCEQIAKVPEEKFEAYIAAKKDAGKSVNADEVTRTVVRAADLDKVKAVRPELPAGRYNVIVIDPPWEMQKIERDVAPNQVLFDYPTMDEAELSAFDVPSITADNCHLFCWATHKHLPLALRLVETWGFRYVCMMVWHKPGGFQPFGLPQYNCEFVIYARHGTPSFTETKAFPVCFDAPRKEHSRKPDYFYELVARVTDGKRIDVFSREAREGFAQFGNETAKFAA